jgi:hypothetical protein
MQRISGAVLGSLIVVFGLSGFALPAFAAGPRSGVGPCRIGALALVSMIDDKSENSADYRSTYAAVVESCGQDTPAPQPLTPAPDRASCRDQAIGLVDIIEDGKMNTKAFVTARDKFAQTCPPLN